MELFLCMLTDIIHSVTIIITCGLFFSLQRREIKTEPLLFLFSGLIICATSLIINFLQYDIAELIIYILTMVSLIFMIYKTKIQIFAIALWSVFAVSVLDIMTTVFVNIFLDLFNFVPEFNFNIISALISFSLVIFWGRIYRKNTSSLLQNVGLGNLIGFTILLVVDAFVVSSIIVGADMYDKSIKKIYLIAVLFIIIGVFIQLAAVIILFAQRNVHKEKEQILDAYLNEQKNHYEYLENREKETKKFRHDLRSHMDLISNLAKRHDYDKIDDYLEQMNTKIDTFGNVVTVHNGIVDAIINQYYMKAQENGVQMKVEGKFPVDCSIEAYDLCTIFSNVLSNAYEAAVETEEKKISLVCGYTERNIIIAVENSCRKKTTTEGGLWKTKKNNADYHGYGLENIKDSVQKYDGIFDIEIKDNMCMLKILFNYKNES